MGSPEGVHLRADRLLSLLMLLQARGRMTAHQLAERLEVSERTIYRDIEALAAAGVPVYTECGPARQRLRQTRRVGSLLPCASSGWGPPAIACLRLGER